MFCLFLCDISLFQPWQGTCLQLTPLLSTRWSQHHQEEDNFDANPRNGLLVHYHNDIYFDGDGDARWYWWGWWMTSTTLFECLEHPLRCFAWVKSMRCTVWPKSKKDQNLFPTSFLPLCPANILIHLMLLNIIQYPLTKTVISFDWHNLFFVCYPYRHLRFYHALALYVDHLILVERRAQQCTCGFWAFLNPHAFQPSTLVRSGQAKFYPRQQVTK